MDPLSILPLYPVPHNETSYILTTLWDTRVTAPSPGCPVLCVYWWETVKTPGCSVSGPKGPCWLLGFSLQTYVLPSLVLNKIKYKRYLASWNLSSVAQI